MPRFAFLSLVVSLTVTVAGCNDTTATSPSGPNPARADLGTLSVGQVRAMTFADAQNGLVIPANLASAQYLIVAANLNLNSDVVQQYTVTGDWLPAKAPTTVAVTRLPSPTRPVFTLIGRERGATFEAQLRGAERRRLAPILSRTAGSPLLRAQLQPPLPRATVVPTVGQSMTIKTLPPDKFNGTSGDICSSPESTTGTVQAVSQHAIVVRDNRLASISGGFTQADYQQIATEFDQKIFPADSSYFGAPTDIDNNGHIILYYTPSVNLLTPAGTASQKGYVGGFFFAGDLFDPSQCAESNHGEIFYLLAPDPTGVYGNQFATSNVQTITRGTMAHEFQHMINAGNRFLNSAASGFESTWLDEGLAHMAEEVVGRAETNIGDLTTITATTVNAMPDAFYFAFFAQNFGRAQLYVERPDTTGPIVGQMQAQNNLASRGAIWMLLRYAADWFSGNNPRTLTRTLAAGPDTGITNLRNGVGVPLDTLLGRWLVTLYTDHNDAISNLDPVYQYKSFMLRDILLRILINDGTGAGAYLNVHSIGSGAGAMTVGIASSGGAYFLTDQTTGSERTIRIVANNSVSTPDPNGRIYVVRVQ